MRRRALTLIFIPSLLLLCQGALSWTCRGHHDDRSRRQLIGTIVPVVGIAALLHDPLVASAATTLDPGEAIRQSASKLPGYGPADVYYPLAFQGSWTMHRQVIVGDTITLDLTHDVRFLPSIQDGAVVADRSFNRSNLENAIAPDSIQTVDWNESNPNDLRIVFRDGRTKDIKVTKRSSERTDTTVSSSEFQRVVTQDSINGVPQITARRVLTKWKVDDHDGTMALQGIELVYDMGGGGDPMSMTNLNSSQQQPAQVLLSKSRLTLTRK